MIDVLGFSMLPWFARSESEAQPVVLDETTVEGDPEAPVVLDETTVEGTPDAALPGEQLYALAGTVGAAMGAYHGYKRTGHVGWAIAWGVAGFVAPILTVPISIAQGFGKPKGK